MAPWLFFAFTVEFLFVSLPSTVRVSQDFIVLLSRHDIILLPVMLSCTHLEDENQRSVRNRTSWQKRPIESSDDALIFSEERQRAETRWLPRSVVLISKVSLKGKREVLCSVAGSVGEKQKSSVI